MVVNHFCFNFSRLLNTTPNASTNQHSVSWHHSHHSSNFFNRIDLRDATTNVINIGVTVSPNQRWRYFIVVAPEICSSDVDRWIGLFITILCVTILCVTVLWSVVTPSFIKPTFKLIILFLLFCHRFQQSTYSFIPQITIDFVVLGFTTITVAGLFTLFLGDFGHVLESW